ncbi:MAG TPA: M55 family metallopeptidase [Gemmatimonadales bacterium]|jgi:D-amino peptidase|nr:M55 family metallopeptidase [Gemmatimonadales bacterium]
MRVYISVDMEGVAGVVHEDQTDPIEPRHAGEYNRFRRLMTAEANAAIEGAVAAGAAAVLVNDSHWLMRNLLAEELHPAAELLSGGPKLHSMVEGIDGGFDAALFIGYHARAGTHHAVIDHTYTSLVHEVRLNGLPVGELAINAALAGTYGVPVALVSGDQALAAEARELLGDGIETVTVKHAVGQFAARSVAPVEACRRIRAGTIAALGRPHQPFRPTSPVRLEVEFALTRMADMAELVPGSVRSAGRTVAYSDDDFREVFRAWRAMYNLASVE